MTQPISRELLERLVSALDRAMYVEQDPEEKDELMHLYDTLVALEAEQSDGGE